MELINARSDLLPQTLLTSRVYDDQFDQQRGFLGALENVQAGARILLGGSSSGSAASAAFVAQTFDTALLSWAASSPTLADKRQYPNFLRVCQNDASQAVAMAWMTRYHFGWDRVAIMYTNDLYGSSGASAFVNSAQDFNISIITQQGFAMGAIDADITPPLMRVKTSRARISQQNHTPNRCPDYPAA
jgi:ABC-type branched-subunit amino acid transport system substrate-binding protein